MDKIFIQTRDEKIKKLIKKWRKENSDISQEIVAVLLMALETGLLIQ